MVVAGFVLVGRGFQPSGVLPNYITAKSLAFLPCSALKSLAKE